MYRINEIKIIVYFLDTFCCQLNLDSLNDLCSYRIERKKMIEINELKQMNVPKNLERMYSHRMTSGFLIFVVVAAEFASRRNLQKYEDLNDSRSLSSFCIIRRHNIYFAHHKFRWPNHLPTTLVKWPMWNIAEKKNVRLYACGFTFFFLQILTVFSAANSFRSLTLICLIHATASIQVAILFLLLVPMSLLLMLLCQFRFVSH